MTDSELINLARETISQRFIEGRHHIGAALITQRGHVFTGVHLEAYIGRVAVCAEAIAIGAAATAGDTDIHTIVAVTERGDVVSPCGICRELITDYAPTARVLIPGNGEVVAVSVGELLPNRYRRQAE